MEIAIPPFKLLTPLTCSTLACICLISGCNKHEDSNITRYAENDKVYRLIPGRVKDRKQWATDILTAMDENKDPHTLENICSVIAIIDQESSFHANPVVPNLAEDAKKALFERVELKLGNIGLVRFKIMLKDKPSLDDNFMSQIGKIRTERDLDLLYRQMFDYFRDHYGLSVITGAMSLIEGHDMKEYLNPIKTLGSMQVHVNYAFKHARASSKSEEIRDEMYTQSGGVYYGTGRLLNYPARYDDPIYRFADYNSGIYSSRNAAFQQVISKLSDIPLALDGDLLSYDKDQNALSDRSNTESQIDLIADQQHWGMSVNNIRSDLLKEKDASFEDTATYRKINEYYKERFKKDAPYAVMPHVEISGPKLSRDYDTNWYANRVNGRYLRCANIGRHMRFNSSSTSDDDE